MTEKMDEYLQEKWIQLVFLMTLLATSGSLYVSRVAGWHVCGICWIQRALMYPLPVVAGYSILRDREDISALVLPLSTSGMFTSIYHFSSIVINPTRTCGFYLPCSMGEPLYLGFLVRPRYIPLSAFLVFTAVTVLAWRYRAS